MTGWDWLAAVAAAIGLLLAGVYAVQGMLANAYRKGYEKGAEEGFQKGVFEAMRTVRTHSTQTAARTVRKPDPKAEGDEGEASSA